KPFLLAEQGVEKSDVSAGAGIGLGRAGHAEFHFAAVDGGEDIIDRDIPSDEAKFFCKTLADAEYDRGQGNGLAVFDQMLCVAEGCPYAAGRPDSVIVRGAA